MTAIEPATSPARRLDWQAAEVRGIIAETARVKTLHLSVADWPGHRPGQHVDVRLTAEDGYQAERSYSIASPPEEPILALTIEEIDNGEVSSYLGEDLQVGDRFELRGPIGGYFVWTAEMEAPLCLIAGGSGIVPLMAMLRHRQRRGAQAPAALLYSSRTVEDVIYRRELDAMAATDPGLAVVHTLTRRTPPGWTGPARRVDRALLDAVCFAPGQRPDIYVCGPTPFVETVSRLLVELGHDPSAIRTERFGPTGGEAP